MCHQSEKLVQLTRVILHETREHQSSRFILYFATCASVDYFYRVRNFFLMPSTFSVLIYSIADSAVVFARNRPAFLTPRFSPSFRADADTGFICNLHFDRRGAFVAPGYRRCGTRIRYP
jgi:hypothetical protein